MQTVSIHHIPDRDDVVYGRRQQFVAIPVKTVKSNYHDELSRGKDIITPWNYNTYFLNHCATISSILSKLNCSKY